MQDEKGVFGRSNCELWCNLCSNEKKGVVGLPSPTIMLDDDNKFRKLLMLISQRT